MGKPILVALSQIIQFGVAIRQVSLASCGRRSEAGLYSTLACLVRGGQFSLAPYASLD